ncbi:WYL domain-containing protein [Eisenbergiella sp.]
MELFHEIYSCYFDVVRRILAEAQDAPVSVKRMEEIARAHGFQETALAILPKLTSGAWPLLDKPGEKEYHSRLSQAPRTPLSGLQKSWLKALLGDRRIRLFLTDEDISRLNRELSQVQPLYSDGDFHYYDRYTDGDPMESETYRAHFQTALRALREGRILLVTYEGKEGRMRSFEAAPYQIQYSSKDDKFRLCCLKYSRGAFHINTLLNFAKIRDCRLSSEYVPASVAGCRFQPVSRAAEPVLLQISGERNSLERCMLHFASYEKHTEYDEENDCWLCSIYYDSADETELLIDVLSFGPVVKVLGPEAFLAQVRERVKRQHELLYRMEF